MDRRRWPDVHVEQVERSRSEYTSLRLNARLLAKLLTQSYLASERGRGHPGMGTNPISINLDPEFQRLNPGLDTIAREAAATVLSLSEGSDVMHTLTSYIAADKDAMAFIDGKADPWGMVVNPSYRKITLPTAQWPLLDDYVPPSELECYQQNPAPYFTQVAAPVTSLRKIAEAVLDAWPNVQTKCDRATAADPWKIGRVDRQGVGTRFMLGLVSTGDARRLGLNEAALLTRGGSYVRPTDAAMARALKAATPSKSGDEPFALDMDDVLRADGYPGTMVVYTAARTANLPEEDAAKVEQFIEVATTEGQQPGFGNGELPAGFLPLRRSGVTAPLWKQAQVVAGEIAAQEGATAAEDGAPGDAGGGAGSGAGGSGGGDGSGQVVPIDGTNDGATTDEKGPGRNRPGKDAGPTDADADPLAMPDTVEVSSPVAAKALPALLSTALVGAMLAIVLRIALLRRRRRA